MKRIEKGRLVDDDTTEGIKLDDVAQNPTPEEQIEELRNIVQEFIQDVDYRIDQLTDQVDVLYALVKDLTQGHDT